MQHVQMDWKPVDLYIYKASVTLVMSIQSKETLKRQYLRQYLPTIICVLRDDFTSSLKVIRSSTSTNIFSL